MKTYKTVSTLLLIMLPACASDGGSLDAVGTSGASTSGGATAGEGTDGANGSTGVDEPVGSGTGVGDSGPADGTEGGGDEGTSAACGDGDIDIDAGESCDEGPANGIYGGCAVDCAGPGPHCGDGQTQEGYEECDDGNDVDGDGCNVDCKPSGQELWSWTHDGGPYRLGRVAVADDGRVALAGQESATERWVAGLSAEGQPQWETSYPGPEIGGTHATSLFPLAGSWIHLVDKTGINSAFQILSAANGSIIGSLPLVCLGHSTCRWGGRASNGDVAILRNYGVSGIDPQAIDEPPVSSDWSQPFQDGIAFDWEPTGLNGLNSALAVGDSTLYVVSEDETSLSQRGFHEGLQWSRTDILHNRDSAERSLAYAAEAGLYMSGSGSASQHDPSIRLYSSVNGDILMSQDLDVTELRNCSASNRDLFCIVIDAGTHLHKYDQQGDLVWSKQLAGVAAAYFVQANPDGTSFVWNHHASGVTVWKLSQ